MQARLSTGAVSAGQYPDTGTACHDALERYAGACRTGGDTRTEQQRMADRLADVVLRPGERALPPVQAQPTITAAAATLLGGDEPGEVDGEPLAAEVIREIAYALGLLPRPTAPTSTVSSDKTDPCPVPPRADTAAEDAVGERRAALADLLLARRVTGTTLAARPQVAVTHPLTGALLALTDAAATRRGESIGRPGRTLDHRAAADVDRFVRARDRRCRFPGCPARPRRCYLDHQAPYDPGGPPDPATCAACASTSIASRPSPRLGHDASARWRHPLDAARWPPGHHPPTGSWHRRRPATRPVGRFLGGVDIARR